MSQKDVFYGMWVVRLQHGRCRECIFLGQVAEENRMIDRHIVVKPADQRTGHKHKHRET